MLKLQKPVNYRFTAFWHQFFQKKIVGYFKVLYKTLDHLSNSLLVFTVFEKQKHLLQKAPLNNQIYLSIVVKTGWKTLVLFSARNFFCVN